MRVYAPGGASLAVANAPARRAGGSGFSLPSDAPTKTPRGAANIRAVPNLDALLALQAVEEPGERRRRAVKRGQAALDVLEEMKLAVLSGSLDPASLGRLKSALGRFEERSGDPQLDFILSQIELRAEVELAKYSAR
ncbi:MAG: hypothetical protein QOD74_654 [Variibacter sp.]|nr:hypothetical protein [Variibacter sp.]